MKQPIVRMLIRRAGPFGLALDHLAGEIGQAVGVVRKSSCGRV
jgi:hypothetical protein